MEIGVNCNYFIQLRLPGSQLETSYLLALNIRTSSTQDRERLSVILRQTPQWSSNHNHNKKMINHGSYPNAASKKLILP